MNKLKFSLQPDMGTLSEKDAKRYFSTVGFAAFALILISYVGSILLSLLISFIAPSLFDSNLAMQIVSVLPLYGMAFPVFFLILRRLPRDRVQPEKMGIKNVFAGFCVAIALMMAGNYVGNFLILFFESATGRTLTNPVESMTMGQAWWINLIFVAILAPILEELVFRKILCDRLLPLGEGYAVAISAVVFGLAHGNFYQFFYAFLLGALFALIYVKTGRIRYSAVYHMIINLLGGVFAPWLLNKLEPLMQEETLNELMGLVGSDSGAAMELLGQFFLPLVLLGGYELLMLGASVCGIVFLAIGRKKVRLVSGLLPPPKEGRIATVFCNVGVAAALTVFAAVFVLSLWG